MSDTPPPTPNGIVPHLVVSDGVAALDFYARAFGAKETFRMPAEDGKRLLHASMELNGGNLFLCDDFPEMNDGKTLTPTGLGGSPVVMHLHVPDVDATFDQAIAAGGEVIMPVSNQFWGDRYGMVRDPFGHRWSIATTL